MQRFRSYSNPDHVSPTPCLQSDASTHRLSKKKAEISEETFSTLSPETGKEVSVADPSKQRMKPRIASDPRDEAQLIDRFLSGDRETFAELVRPHLSALYGVALAILKNQHDAEESVQEAVLRAMTHLAGFRRESRFSTWITQITINEARMRLRKARRHIYRSLDEEVADGAGKYSPRDFADWREIPSESLERSELRDALWRALEGLPPAAREVILLRDVQNYSTAETAQMLGISVVSVKSRLLRARLQIRDALAPGIDGAWSLGETKWRKIRPW